ncbi:sensor histidine kinase [Lysobacter tyrosinilyticus]
MIRHLYLRIYLTTLAALAVVVLLSVATWRFTSQHSVEVEHARFVAALLDRTLPAAAAPDVLDRTLADFVSAPVLGVALFDQQRTRLGSAGTLTNVGDATILAQGSAGHAIAWRSIRLRDGRLLIAQMRTNAGAFHLHALLVITLVTLLVALASYPMVRRLTLRLETLAQCVDRFGEGELAARAPVAGRDEVAALSTSFNRMAGRVTNLLDAHRRLLANASHELRSPLARVRLALDLHESNPSPELLRGMRQDCAEIDSQIEEVLLASKLDTIEGALVPESVDLAGLLAEECVRLDVPFDVIPVDVPGDSRLLRKLIRNLIENALKHGGQDVRASLRMADNGPCIIDVADRGPGIAADERERIFEPFYRPANSRETGSGWGLGLSLVKQIAHRHGGSVSCLAREGGGCIFEVTLPQH